MPGQGGQADGDAQPVTSEPPAQAAQLLSDYASGWCSWEAFVQHNWLPVLGLALGPSWREQYDGEVAAMVALQLALQPSGGSSSGAAAAPAADGAHPAQAALQQKQPATPASAPAAAAGAAAAAAAGEAAASSRARAAEALDVDGKRRRLRRKRAASPDSPCRTQPAQAQAATYVAADVAADAAADSSFAAAAAESSSSTAEGGGGAAAAAGTATDGSKSEAGARPSLVQRVIRQVSKLSMGPQSPSLSDGGDSSGQGGAGAGAPASLSAAPGAAAAALAGSGGSPVPTAVGPGGGAGGLQQIQIGLLDSLSLVHDLSQRIVTNLQEVVQARGLGLSLPQQLAQPAAAAEGAAAGGAAGGLPLSVLLGGSLMDRMDLLGRTALHVAAATGRAEVVRQLAAAGASVDKPLPMDYRALLKQSAQQQQPAVAAAAAAAPAGGSSERGEAIAAEPCSPECEEAATGDTLGLEGEGDGADWLEGRAPPPKRGRYVTAGPSGPGRPSLQYCTALHLAALQGQLEVVQALLATGQCDVNCKSIEGATALHLAAFAGHAELVACLCRAPGAHINSPDLQGRTPLHLAAAQGHSGAVTELWARGAAIDACDLHGWSALHYAARAGHSDVAAQLVIAGSHVAACDPHGLTAAHLAAERGFSDIVDKCLCAGYVPDSLAGPLADGTEGGTALHLAAAQGWEAVVELLLEAGADPCHLDFAARNALDLAVLHGHLHLVPPLLEAGCWFSGGEGSEDGPPQPGPGEPGHAQVGLLWCLSAEAPWELQAFAGLQDGTEVVADSFRLTFAECAARAGQLETLQRLHPRGLDLSGGSGCAVLAAAVHSGAAPLVRWLLDESGGRCDVAAALDQEDLLHEAASRGDVEVLQALVAAAGGASLGRVDGRGLGRTPLHSAVIHSQAAAAELLVEVQLAHPLAGGGSSASAAPDAAGGAGLPLGLDAADAQGYTALHWAAAKGSVGLLGRLLAAGANKEAAASDGMTPLHLAAKAGHVGAVRALLDAGCRVAALDTHGCMPLHYAALRGDLALFVLLFSHSAPALAGGASGAALLTAAIRGGSSEMAGIVLLTGVTTPAKCREAGQTPVHSAAREGSLDVLQYLYGAGFNMADLDGEGKSPLHHAPIGAGQPGLAARRGAAHRQVAEALLASNCQVDTQDAHGCTPVHFAAGAGALGMLRRFLEVGGSACVDVPDSIGWTPLFWACNNGHAGAVERLLQEGASPWRKDCNQRMPLHFASEAGHVACVRLLVGEMRRTAPARQAEASAAGTAPLAAAPPLLELRDQNGQTPVQLAAEHGHPECAALLLDADGSAEAKRRTALHLAAQQGHLELVNQVLATRRLAVSAKDADGWLPLHYAAAAGHAEVVSALLGAGSDVDEQASDGESPLHKAALAGHLPVVLLLKSRSALDQRNLAGSTALYNASSQGHLAVMRELVEEGATVDAATTNGCTPLYIAANNGWAEAAALLLHLGADPDLETTSGCTPLHAAALNGHAPVVCELVAAGCDIDVQSQNGSSALHNAASGGHAAVVEVLLAAKADCDVQNSNGNTPLHLAAGKGWLDVAERLAAAGADPHIKNSKGWLAIQSAANAAYFEVVLRLVQHGSPWRLKGDADVARLLTKKSSYKPSYVEGRLRIADKERQRRLAKAAAAAAAADGAAASSAVELEQAAAAADAVMAELLQEEAATKEREERSKAKKAAKKQQRAAKRQQQLEEEERQRQDEAAAQQEQQVPPAHSSGDDAAAAAEQLASVRLSEDAQPAPAGSTVPARQQQQQQQQHGGPSSKVAVKPAPVPAKPAVKAGRAGSVPASPARTVVTVALKSPPAGANKQAGRPGGTPASPHNTRSDSAVVAAPRYQPVPVKPAVAAAPAPALSQQQQRVQQAQQPHAAPAAVPPGRPISRPAPWAAVAAARAANSAAPLTAVQQQQQAQQAQHQGQAVDAAVPHQAPGITRPAHLSSMAAPAASLGPSLQAASAAAVAAPPLPTWAAPKVPLQQPSATPGSYPAHAALQQPADPLLGATLGSAALPGAYQPPALLAAAMGLSAHQSMPAKHQPQQQGPPQVAAELPPTSSGFVPLFGLSLPAFQGLGTSVDWSMPAGTAVPGGYGPPAPQQLPPLAAAPMPLAQPPAAAAYPAAAAGFVGGSFSPSDASSIESAEADDLLAGIRHALPGGAAALLARAGAPHAASPGKPGFADVLPAAATDADGIDDVLRLQPWLE